MRTAVSAVKVLLQAGGDYDEKKSPAVQQFVEAASIVVDRVYSCAIAKGVLLSDTELELIERWLAAHFYCCSDQQYSSKANQGASGSFRAAGGTGYDATTYGQQAKLLDYSGCLARSTVLNRVKGFWMGSCDASY